MRVPRALQPLEHRDFRLLWTGQSVSAVGNFVHNVALPFQVLALGGGALELGLWSGIFAASSLTFALFGGAVADRLPRRTVVLASDLSAGIVVGTIAVLAVTGLLRIEHLYIEAALFGAAESFFQPAVNALIPELVPAEILQAGNALRGTGREVALLAGPVLGGFLVALAGPSLAFGVDAAPGHPKLPVCVLERRVEHVRRGERGAARRRSRPSSASRSPTATTPPRENDVARELVRACD